VRHGPAGVIHISGAAPTGGREWGVALHVAVDPTCGPTDQEVVSANGLTNNRNDRRLRHRGHIERHVFATSLKTRRLSSGGSSIGGRISPPSRSPVTSGSTLGIHDMQINFRGVIRNDDQWANPTASRPLRKPLNLFLSVVKWFGKDVAHVVAEASARLIREHGYLKHKNTAFSLF
jgi:hypothetical protein